MSFQSLDQGAIAGTISRASEDLEHADIARKKIVNLAQMASLPNPVCLVQPIVVPFDRSIGELWTIFDTNARGDFTKDIKRAVIASGNHAFVEKMTMLGGGCSVGDLVGY